MQSMHQQGSGPCIEIGHFGMEEELERLKRDRNVMMTEIIKLRQQQQSSRAQIVAMEERIRNTERKHQQIMSFLAKIFTNPSFVQQYLDKYTLKKDQRRVEIGQKRRLTMTPSVENLQDIDEAELEIETDMGSFISAALDNESSYIMNPSPFASISGTKTDPVPENIWEELIGEGLGNQPEEVLIGNEAEVDVEVEDLVAETPEWGEDLQDLVDHMGYL